jgi:predicted dehydrogenase
MGHGEATNALYAGDPGQLLLVGCGPMAIAYAKVLTALGVVPVVVGRGTAAAARFESETGIAAHAGGLERWLAAGNPPVSRAIVAVGEGALGVATLQLIEHGVGAILVEKPGGASAPQIRRVSERARQRGAAVWVGYNRRFYASAERARAMIREDGGVTSFNFEFTEWSHVIAGLAKEPGVKEQWFLHNSTHVVDLAFFLAGTPQTIACHTAGHLDWHPSAAVFSGAGISNGGALFSYQANWGAPGRWGVEILTNRRRLIFRPLETLQVQLIGSVAIEPVQFDDAADRSFKPGLLRQVQAFLGGDGGTLCPLAEQVSLLSVYTRIAGYDDPPR